MRTNFDFASYHRSTVGFDRLFEMLETRLAPRPKATRRSTSSNRT